MTAASIFLLTAACSQPPPPPAGELVFLRDAVLSPVSQPATASGAADAQPGRQLANGSRLVPRAWTPGQVVELDGLTATAPARAECLPLFSVELGDVSRLVAMGGAAPNTAMAFSPGDGSRLAIGSYLGEVRVVDGWSGQAIAKRRLAETLVKQVAWSADGGTLYVAEQSPDATLRALDPATLQDRWTLRLADIVETSALPPGDDLYGVYALPAAYGLVVLPDGDLLVTAVHSWTPEDGRKKNRSQVLRVSPDGTIEDRWPDAPADATFLHPRVDREGGLVAFAINRSADGPPPPDLAVGGVQVLDLATLQPKIAVTTEPLRPWFTEAFVWEALDVSARQDALFLGFGDGRIRVTDLAGADRLSLDVGAPVMAGEVPIHASVGWGLLRDDTLIFNSSNTLIPYGAASPELRPPSAHPAENTLFAVGLDGQRRWSWSGGAMIQGLTLSPDGDTLVLGAGARKTDDRRDAFGAFLFDLSGPADRSGEQRLEAFCATSGPVFFRHAISDDGRVAVSEHPILEGDGSIAGAYQVTVLR